MRMCRIGKHHLKFQKSAITARFYSSVCLTLNTQTTMSIVASTDILRRRRRVKRWLSIVLEAFKLLCIWNASSIHVSTETAARGEYVFKSNGLHPLTTPQNTWSVLFVEIVIFLLIDLVIFVWLLICSFLNSM